MDVEIYSPQAFRDELNDANPDQEVDYGQQLCDDILKVPESSVAASQDDGPTISVPDHTYPRLYLGTKKCPRKSVLVTFYKC